MRIVGVCRFSLIGRGDWQAYRDVSDEALESVYESAATELFAPERLEARLRSFENLTLASMARQTDKNFLFLVLSSDRMPEKYRSKLEELCAKVPHVVLRFYPPTDVGSAVIATCNDLNINLSEFAQFRLDDDDCLSIRFIERLKVHCERMRDLRPFAISFGRNLAVSIYRDRPINFWRYNQAFFSAGLAIRPKRAGRTVFHFGHFAVQRRMDHFVDQSHLGALVLKWPSDSIPMNPDRPGEMYVPIPQKEFSECLERDFPYLIGFDFETLRPTSTNPTSS